MICLLEESDKISEETIDSAKLNDLDTSGQTIIEKLKDNCLIWLKKALSTLLL